MRIKPEIREKIEKAFRDAGFDSRLDWDIEVDNLYAQGQAMPIKIVHTKITATLNVPNDWIEYDKV